MGIQFVMIKIIINEKSVDHLIIVEPLKFNQMKNNQHKTLDDIVFENRNKSYGAYYNRQTANRGLLKSLGIGILIIGIFALMLSFIKKEETEDSIWNNGEHTLIDFSTEDNKVIEVELSEKIPSKPKLKKSENLDTEFVPTPSVNTNTETPIKNNSELGQATSLDGDDTEGDDSLVQNNNVSVQGTPDGLSNVNVGTPLPEAPKKTEYFARDVTKMAIFPGCEKFENDKNKAQLCIAEKLQNELSTQLDGFKQKAERFQIREAKARLQFIVNKKGEIVDIQAMRGGNAELNKESKEALERIARKMVQQKRHIQPAKFSDGTPVNIVLAIPIQFNLEN